MTHWSLANYLRKLNLWSVFVPLNAVSFFLVSKDGYCWNFSQISYRYCKCLPPLSPTPTHSPSRLFCSFSWNMCLVDVEALSILHIWCHQRCLFHQFWGTLFNKKIVFWFLLVYANSLCSFRSCFTRTLSLHCKVTKICSLFQKDISSDGSLFYIFTAKSPSNRYLMHVIKLFMPPTLRVCFMRKKGIASF